MSNFLQWFTEHYIEVFGAITGLIYIYFSIRQSIWLWLTGIITSAIYIYVYFSSKFYADMSLQVYYLVISIYGWIYWYRGKENNKKNLPVRKTPFKTAVILLIITALIFFFMGYFLDIYTDSPLPYWDAFTTALSITATFMLTRKFIEQWLMWIVIDAVSAALYFYKGLYATVILFIVYTILAVVGFIQWQRAMQKEK